MVKRVRVVVREVAVILTIERVVRDVGVLERGGLGDAHAVSEVKREVKRALHVRELLDVRGVVGRDVDLRDLAASSRRLVAVHAGDKLLDVLDASRSGDRHCVRLAELAAVPLLRVMRSGDHDRPVGAKLGVCKIAHRRRGEANVDDIDSFVHETLRERGEKRVRRLAAVARDHHLAALAGEAAELRVSARNLVEVVLLKFRAVDAADVVCLEDAH